MLAGSGSPEVGTVRDWMTRHPVTVEPDTPVATVARLMRTNRIRHVLVVEAGALVGIVSDRDVRGELVEGVPTVSPASPVRQVMSEMPVTVAPDAPLVAAARQMLDRKIGALPVLEGDRPVGILTTADALEALLRWVEHGSARRGA